jgi:hypothetical protein
MPANSELVDGTNVAYNGSKWVAIGGSNSNCIYTSVNASEWIVATSSAFGTDHRGTSLAFNGDTWVATVIEFSRTITTSSNIWYSSDNAVTWFPADNSPFELGNGPRDVAYSSGKWVAVGTGYSKTSNVWYSTNGSEWTVATGGPFDASREGGKSGTTGAAVYGANNSWIAVGYGRDSNSNIWESTNGIEWFAASGGAFGNNQGGNSILYGGGKWVSGGMRDLSGSAMWYMVPQ